VETTAGTAMRSRDETLRRALIRVAQAAIGDEPIDSSSLALDAGAWEAFADLAERHQLAPLAHACLAANLIALPITARRQLDSIALRARAWRRARSAALRDVLAELRRASIDPIVLKGAALAWLIYPSPDVRPMSDIDLLVPRDTASTASHALEAIGFRPDPWSRQPRPARHHHLPALTRPGALPISIELHVDAIDADARSSIASDTLTSPLQPFAMDGVPALTLGDRDMLRHLCHHALQPSWDGHVRLLGIVDLFRYAAAHATRIDWTSLERDEPFVLNVLRCLHYVVPLPTALAHLAPPRTWPTPVRAGETLPPLRALSVQENRIDALRGLVVDPPAWWLHAYYGVPLDRPLGVVRLWRHPCRVAYWMRRRVWPSA
jgi:hypothetical protein